MLFLSAVQAVESGAVVSLNSRLDIITMPSIDAFEIISVLPNAMHTVTSLSSKGKCIGTCARRVARGETDASETVTAVGSVDCTMIIEIHR